MSWQSPSLTVLWGRYFPPDPEEESKIVATVQEALGSKNGTPIIQLRHAVQKVASIYGIENVEAALEGLEVENEKRRQDAQDAAVNEAAQLHDLAAGGNREKPAGEGRRSRGDAKAPSGGGSGSSRVDPKTT